jgi:hypothetical protein
MLIHEKKGSKTNEHINEKTMDLMYLLILGLNCNSIITKIGNKVKSQGKYIGIKGITFQS